MSTTKLFFTFFLSAILCLAAHQARATGLSVCLEGIVLDAVSGLPIENAKVELGAGAYTCLTDRSGRFSFTEVPSGDWVISASRMGYKTADGVQVTVNQDVPQRVQLQMEPAAIVLPGQRVTGTRLDYNLFTSPALVVTAAEINEAGFQDLTQVLASLPGITVNAGYSTSGTPQVTITGETGKRLGITLDGVSLAEGIRGETDLSVIPLAAVENIEIRRGGQWGDAALGGSVRINTRRAFPTERVISVNYGSSDQRSLSSAVSGMAGPNYGYLVTAEDVGRGDTYTYAREAGDDSVRANAGYRLRKIYAKLGGRLTDNWDWRVSGLLHENNRGVPGPLSMSFPVAAVKERRRILTADITGVWHNRFSVSLRSSASDFRTHYRDSLTYPMHTQYDETAYVLDAAVLYSPGANSPLTVSAGGEVYHRALQGFDYLASRQPFDEASRTTDAVWVQTRLRCPADVSPWLGGGHITGGVRYDRDGQTPSYWAPRINAGWGWGRPRVLNLSAGWVRSFRRPLLTSLHWEDAYSHGNPVLEPEKSREWDVKIEIIPPRTNLVVHTRFFDRAYDGFIEWASGPNYIFSPVNLPRAMVVGREDGFTWSGFGQRLSIDFFHTLMWATDEAPGVYQGKSLLYRPKHAYQLKTTVQYRGLNVRLEARWEDKQFIDKQNTKWIPPYRWFDLFVRQMIPWNTVNMFVSLRCENLTNESAALRDGYPLPGRTVGAGVELHF